MRFTRLGIAGSVLASLMLAFGGGAYGQDCCESACDVACCEADDCGGCGGCGSCCGGGIAGILDGLCFYSNAEPITLAANGPITVGGHIQAGAYNYNTGMFNDYPDNLNLNQAWIYAERALAGDNYWDWGFRFDFMYGTDGPDTQAFGNVPKTYDYGWNSGQFYGSALPQSYFEVGKGNLSVKLGHFYTIAGYEVVPATGNFFYSHAFTMYYAESFTHTGVLATYTADSGKTYYGGWGAGWDTGWDGFGGNCFLGGISMPIGEFVTATYTCTFGTIGFGTDADGYSHSIVIAAQLTDRLEYVFQTDYIDFEGVVTSTLIPPAAPGDPALFRRHSFNNYLFYTINDCLKAGARLEYFRAQDSNADLYEVTVGVNYQPHPNVMIRPEVRWDKDTTGFTIPPGYNERLGVGCDMIVTF